MSKVEPLRGRGPNILLIMADQHRADWMGCAGAHWVQTPNLDALASRGLRFSRAATNSPVCAPARSALASGRRCGAVGVTDNADLYPYRTVPTHYQALRAAGYWVGCVGKTDLHKKDHFEGRLGNQPIMHHLGFTHPYETEGKQSAARFSDGPHCPYQHHLAERGWADAFQQDYERRSHVLCADDSVLPHDALHDAVIGDRA
ncbi:MAG: sulfatase-like hydrolase/transferase, partial [Candidatus Sumerlaeota bacterium]|nr:sulfatase-like hydrolase/transferase [Candidatus Sumerlaeota bacterium]